MLHQGSQYLKWQSALFNTGTGLLGGSYHRYMKKCKIEDEGCKWIMKLTLLCKWQGHCAAQVLEYPCGMDSWKNRVMTI